MSLHMRLKAEQKAREAGREEKQALRDEEWHRRDAKMEMRFGHLDKASVAEAKANEARIRAANARSRKEVAEAEAEAWKHDDPSAFRAKMQQKLAQSASPHRTSDLQINYHCSPGGSPSMTYNAGVNVSTPAASMTYGAPAPGFTPQSPYPPYPIGTATLSPYPPPQSPGYPPAASPQVAASCYTNNVASAPAAPYPNPPATASGCYNQTPSANDCPPIGFSANFPDVSVQVPTFTGSIGFPGFSMKF